MDVIPIVSIVIPMYNNGNSILRAVRSVQGQTFRELEVLVVDDGSDDDGLEQVKALNDERVRLFRLPHRNANVARNYGIRHSRGKYIAMLDADDEWTDRHLECSLQVLQAAGADGVYGSLILRGESDQLVTTRAIRDGETTIDFLLANGYAAQTSTLVMTAASAADVGWDETLQRHQDYNFVVRYCRKYRMCPKEEATTIYYSSHSSKPIDFDSCIRFIRTVENEISDRLYMRYHLHMLRLAIAQSAREDIIRHYRKEATHYEYLLSLYDYLLIKAPRNSKEVILLKFIYLLNLCFVTISSNS